MNIDDPLDRFLGDVRDDVLAQADHGGRVRDFAAMIARARGIDPAAVSAETLADVRRYAPVVALRPPIAARAAAPTQAPAVASPPPPAAGPQARARPSWRLGGVVAAAAIVAILLGAAGLARQDTDARPGHAVQHSISLAPPVVPLAAPAGPSAAIAHAPESMSSETSSPPVPPPPEPSRPAPEPAAPAPSWLELDRLAHDAWRRGDLARARRLLKALIDSDAPSARIELAFGDLFVLARQAGDPQALERAWRAYLVRFPGGLFAEDASAGLCRREGPDCWQRHLDRWPAGPHTTEARDSLAAHHGAP